MVNCTVHNSLFPVGRQNPSGLVIAGKAMDTTLDQNEPEFGILVLHKERSTNGCIKRRTHYVTSNKRMLGEAFIPAPPTNSSHKMPHHQAKDYVAPWLRTHTNIV